MKRNQQLHEWLIPALAMEIGAKSYLELGCHQNETVAAMPDAMGPEARIFAVDINEPNYRVTGVEYRIMNTADYLSDWAGADAPFDLAFIDADHSARAALSDFEAVWRHMAPEGLVLLHDTNPETVADTQPGYCGDSWRVAKYLADSGFESITLNYHPGLTMVRKRVSWGPVDSPPATEEVPGITAGKENPRAVV